MRIRLFAFPDYSTQAAYDAIRHELEELAQLYSDIPQI